MAYLIRVGEKPSYWSGKEDATWVDQASEALEFATKKEAEKEIKEISEALGYSTLNAVKSEDALSVERAVEEALGELSESGEVLPVVDLSLSAEDLRRMHS